MWRRGGKSIGPVEAHCIEPVPVNRVDVGGVGSEKGLRVIGPVAAVLRDKPGGAGSRSGDYKAFP